MIIKHADKHRWIKAINPDIFSDFGKNNTKKITSLLATLTDTTITHTFTLLTEADTIWFTQLYTTNLASKHNPKPHNVYETTLGKPVMKFPYYILTIFEQGKPIGGTIFTLRTDRLSMVYRTYASDWCIEKSKCSPALYAEYLATKFAQDQHLPYLVHGRDQNPYGVNSHVGVAIFKLSVGCSADLTIIHTINETDLNTLPYGSLLLTYPDNTVNITAGYLIGDEETASKYEQLFKYPEQLLVTLFTPTL